ncbi:MAG: hypothetical protein IJV03_03620, partial [Alphaproteobacteria bacterium]|nr:hypothetical protein [Alphaproteobacteria bacterium]
MKNKQNHIYGIIGLVALFLVGGMLGYIANGVIHTNKSVMTEQQCIELSGKISKALSWGKYDELERLNKIYSENCNDRNFDVPEQKAEEQTEKLPSVTCEAVETLLLKRLNELNEDSVEADIHIERAKIYANLKNPKEFLLKKLNGACKYIS